MKRSAATLSPRPALALGFALLLSASMYFYVQYLLIPYQRTFASTHDIPRGNLSDLYPRWLGARALLLDHRDPYAAELTREIQVGYYGRPLDPARPEDPRDQQAFAYPVYVVLLLFPTVKLPFNTVQFGFRWLLIGLALITLLFWLRAFRFRVRPSTLAIAGMLTLSSFPVVQGIKLQQMSLLVSGMIAGCIVLLVEGQLLAAGVLLALATIKPQLVVLLLAWLFLWALGDWEHRRRLVWGSLGALAVLFAVSEYVLPGWIGRFLHALEAYRQYNDGARSVLEVLVTPLWGMVLTALVVLALAVICWRHRRVPSDSVLFGWITALVLASTVLIAPKTSPYNQVLLLPGVLLVIQRWPALWTERRVTRVILLSFGLVLAWPWLAALFLTLASLVVPTATLQKAWAVPLYTSLAIPVIEFVILQLGTAKLGPEQPS